MDIGNSKNYLGMHNFYNPKKQILGVTGPMYRLIKKTLRSCLSVTHFRKLSQQVVSGYVCPINTLFDDYNK